MRHEREAAKGAHPFKAKSVTVAMMIENVNKMKITGSVLLVLLFTGSLCFAQSKKELEQQVSKLISEKQEIMNELLTAKQQMIDLKQEIAALKKENESLKIQIASQSNNKSNESLRIMGNTPLETKDRPKLVGDGRCQAITQAGTQCTRNADSGSNYCWQHKSTFDPNNTEQNIVTTPSQKNDGTEYYNGHKIYTGPRGGKYYINKNGNKTYIKR